MVAIKLFAFLFAICVINESAAFRIPREIAAEAEPTSQEAGEYITSLISSELNGKVPRNRINDVNKVVMDMMLAKTSAEQGANGLKFLKLLIESTLAVRNIPFTPEQFTALENAVDSALTDDDKNPNEITDRDIAAIRTELLKIFSAEVTTIVTDILSTFKENVSSDESGQTMINWINTIIRGTKKRYGTRSRLRYHPRA
ncbi:uncharacterized protein LOC119083296 [Bradysia coprophila]|uniref:uncharacterized protein LOC119083296 n=1 Tax=Bradysia coprophila TaxID=38358 RepID=UPI00187DC16C|nr:uncharacterized protein LOC119083296 [Bradysia coprophila]